MSDRTVLETAVQIRKQLSDVLEKRIIVIRFYTIQVARKTAVEWSDVCPAEVSTGEHLWRGWLAACALPTSVCGPGGPLQPAPAHSSAVMVT